LGTAFGDQPRDRQHFFITIGCMLAISARLSPWTSPSDPTLGRVEQFFMITLRVNERDQNVTDIRHREAISGIS
jgi:hypothetical protein